MSCYMKNKRGQMFKEQKRKCWFCGKFCWYPSKDIHKRVDTMFTVEHIYPKSCGGQDTHYNLIGACYGCNQKRNKQFIEAEQAAEILAYRKHKHLLTKAKRIITDEKRIMKSEELHRLGNIRLLERDRINSKRR